MYLLEDYHPYHKHCCPSKVEKIENTGDSGVNVSFGDSDDESINLNVTISPKKNFTQNKIQQKKQLNNILSSSISDNVQPMKEAQKHRIIEKNNVIDNLSIQQKEKEGIIQVRKFENINKGNCSPEYNIGIGALLGYDTEVSFDL